MSNDKLNFFGGKGWYIALILCAAAIGITSYLYRKNADAANEISMQETAAVMGTDIRLTKPTETPTVTSEPAGIATVPSRPPVTRSLKVVAPVSGEPVNSYSMECLSYNQTTRDWRVHDGMDLAAETGSEVCAAAAGTVTAVYEDDAMGSTVSVTHEGGYVTQYASLASGEVCVQQGDRVEAGQKLGCVGDTALMESALGSHLHFSVTKNGDPMDPAEFLRLGE